MAELPIGLVSPEETGATAVPEQIDGDISPLGGQRIGSRLSAIPAEKFSEINFKTHGKRGLDCSLRIAPAARYRLLDPL